MGVELSEWLRQWRTVDKAIVVIQMNGSRLKATFRSRTTGDDLYWDGDTLDEREQTMAHRCSASKDVPQLDDSMSSLTSLLITYCWLQES